MSADITKLIYRDEDIDEVTELQSRLYEDEIGFDEYLSKALLKLHLLLKEHFQENYIFGKLYYVGSYTPFSFLKIDFYDDKSNPENQIFYNGIQEAEKLVDTKQQTSLSVVLINGRLRGISLHKGEDRPDDIPGISYHNYEGDPSLAFNKIVSEDDIKLNLNVHKEMSEKCPGEVYSYLLRTRNLDRDYNGSLYIVIKKRDKIKGIKVDEYSRIVDFFNHIMQAKLKYDYKQQRNAEWKKIIGQVTHSKINYHSVINDYLTELRLSIKDEISLKRLKDLTALTDRLQAIDSFFFSLNKVGFSKKNFENLTEQNIKEALSISKLNLEKEFDFHLHILERSIKTIPATEPDYLKNVTDYLQQLKIELPLKFKKIKLHAIQVGFSIILFDIIKNAFKNLHSQNPELKVEYYDFNPSELDDYLFSNETSFVLPTIPYMVIAFINNKPMVFYNNADKLIERHIYDRMLGKEIGDHSISNTTQLGLRIIDTIVKYDGLGKSGLKWYYLPSKECLEMKYTKTLLLIPKSDFENGI